MIILPAFNWSFVCDFVYISLIFKPEVEDPLSFPLMRDGFPRAHRNANHTHPVIYIVSFRSYKPLLKKVFNPFAI